MREAFSYMFKDNKFWQKAGLFFVFTLCCELVNYYKKLRSNILPEKIAFVILGVLLSAILAGYALNCIKALKEQEKNYVLPFMNLGKNFVLGIKALITMFIGTIPLYIFLLVSLGIYIQALNIPQKNYETYAFISLGITTVCLILLVLYVVFYMVFYPAFVLLYVEKQSFLTAYRFKALFNLLAGKKKRYFKSYGKLAIVFVGLFAIVYGLYLIDGQVATLLKLLVINNVINVYAVYVNSYILAKALDETAQETKNKRCIIISSIAVIVLIVSLVIGKLVFNKPAPTLYDTGKGYELTFTQGNLLVKAKVKGEKFNVISYENGKQYEQNVYDGGEYYYAEKFGGIKKKGKYPKHLPYFVDRGIDQLVNWQKPYGYGKYKITLEQKDANVNGFDCDMYSLQRYNEKGVACVNKDFGIAVYHNTSSAYGKYRIGAKYELKSIKEVEIDDSEFKLPRYKG